MKQHTNGLCELLHDIPYTLGRKSAELHIVVPKGFKTDFASIPPIGQLVIPKHGNWNGPALIHDWLFQTHLVGFRLANAIMFEAMVEAKVSLVRRMLILTAIKSAFGLHAYATGPERLWTNSPKLAEKYLS